MSRLIATRQQSVCTARWPIYVRSGVTSEMRLKYEELTNMDRGVKHLPHLGTYCGIACPGALPYMSMLLPETCAW